MNKPQIVPAVSDVSVILVSAVFTCPGMCYAATCPSRWRGYMGFATTHPKVKEIICYCRNKRSPSVS